MPEITDGAVERLRMRLKTQPPGEVEEYLNRRNAMLLKAVREGTPLLAGIAGEEVEKMLWGYTWKKPAEIRDTRAKPERRSLYAVTGANTYCGPSAISAVAGIASHEASRILRNITGRSKIRGTWGSEIAWAMQKLGWICAEAHSFGDKPGRNLPDRSTQVDFHKHHIKRISLAKFLDHPRQGHWIIDAGKHWIAYANEEVADSGYFFNRIPQKWDRNISKRRAMIRMAFRFRRLS